MGHKVWGYGFFLFVEIGLFCSTNHPQTQQSNTCKMHFRDHSTSHFQYLKISPHTNPSPSLFFSSNNFPFAPFVVQNKINWSASPNKFLMSMKAWSKGYLAFILLDYSRFVFTIA